MFDMVVATTVSPVSFSCACMSRAAARARIAIHNTARGIAEKGTVGVAVKGDPQIELS